MRQRLWRCDESRRARKGERYRGSDDPTPSAALEAAEIADLDGHLDSKVNTSFLKIQLEVEISANNSLYSCGDETHLGAQSRGVDECAYCG